MHLNIEHARHSACIQLPKRFSRSKLRGGDSWSQPSRVNLRRRLSYFLLGEVAVILILGRTSFLNTLSGTQRSIGIW